MTPSPKTQGYDPETYWSRVGEEIRDRGENFVAGDDNPYYRYKRKKFLRKILDSINVDDRRVLEVGFGPGGNLRHLALHHRPKKLIGADISGTMLALATHNLREHSNLVVLHKIEGRKLPLADRSVDLSYTVTVLQHVTDEQMLTSLVAEICRVSDKEAVITEDIGESVGIGGSGNFIGRRVSSYEGLFSEHGFKLAKVEFLNTRFSRAWYEFIYTRIYRRFVNKRHQEGESIGAVFKFLIGGPMILTRILDDLFPESKSLAKMAFVRR